MIDAMSAAIGGVQTALEQFDRAAQATVSATASAGSVDAGDLAQGFVGMDMARVAVIAALVAARVSNSMLEDVIKSYGTSEDAAV
jgi:hypothetical protein